MRNFKIKTAALAAVCAALLFWAGLCCPAAETVQAAQRDSVVVVADPGPGGTGGRSGGGGVRVRGGREPTA